MTPATLAFLRTLCSRVTLQSGDATFESDALALIAAMHELDEALNANNAPRRDTSRPGDPGRTSLSELAGLNREPN